VTETVKLLDKKKKKKKKKKDKISYLEVLFCHLLCCNLYANLDKGVCCMQHYGLCHLHSKAYLKKKKAKRRRIMKTQVFHHAKIYIIFFFKNPKIS